MKSKSLFIILCLFCCTSMTAQVSKLNYSWGTFSTKNGEKANWKNANHLFEHDQDLLNKYVKFRSAKKTANALGIACLVQASVGAGLIFIPGSNYCESICEHQIIGIGLLILTAPATGLIGIVAAGVASGRKSKLIYTYDRQGLSNTYKLQKEQSKLILRTNGLGIGLTYQF